MSSKPSTPLWRQAYNAWEQSVAPGLQEVTASNGFRDLLAAGLKVNADIAREIERGSRRSLHLLNLPAASDVRRLRQQVTGLEREVLSLRRTIEDQETSSGDAADSPPTAPTSIDGPNGRTATIS